MNTHHPLRVAITGGTSGLGLALVEQLAASGARVAFVARDAQRVASVARRLPGTHGLVGDVSHKADTYPLALQITAALDGLDVLINNASHLGPTPLALLADTDCEDFEAALNTNLLGPFRLTPATTSTSARFSACNDLITSRPTLPVAPVTKTRIDLAIRQCSVIGFIPVIADLDKLLIVLL